MAISVTITLNTVVGTPGPFSLYSDTDSYTTPFVTGVSLVSLQGGYGTSLVPDETISIKIKSTGGCSYEITKSISSLPVTPTPTPTSNESSFLISGLRMNITSGWDACQLTMNNVGSSSSVYGNGTTICNSTTITTSGMGSDWIDTNYSLYDTFYISYKTGGNYYSALYQKTSSSGATKMESCVNCTTLEPTPTPDPGAIYTNSLVLSYASGDKCTSFTNCYSA